ncbi:hypothetical protein GCM10009678_62970 [Actinomadura kijaniata]|uniref:Uncharacterized protein n=1 Tax=Actinomadura namibiensis TaxID=182080 RepID=A0A7W3LWS0_ACTNM|nr:DUF6585 family protein [Actinomadura namibiensis]MBA8955672.1 hypothetical protein [Actinomadura namibiensis]
MPTPRSLPGRAVGPRLGTLVREFDARPARRRALAWLTLLGLAGIALVPAAAVYLTSGRPLLGVPAALLAAGYLGAVAWILARGALRGRDTVVRLHEGGLTVTGSGLRGAYLWDELTEVTVSGVRRSHRARTRWRCVLTAVDGRTLTLGDGLPDVGDLAGTVVAEVARRLVPRVLGVVGSGGTVRFGPFAVGPDGVAKDGRRLPWPAVREVVVGNGLVVVRSHDGTGDLVAMAGETPNAVVLAEVCHRRARSPRRMG